VDIYLLYFLTTIHVYSKMLEIYSTYLLLGKGVNLFFIVFPTIFLHEFIYNLIILYVSLFCEADQLLIGIIYVESYVEIIEVIAVGYFGLISQLFNILFVGLFFG
jgi:hypothetical protein